MPNEFINPNWHVVLIHYPLALLTAGILIELFSFLWPYSTVRTAGRWMILLGALLCVPSVTLGLYALRDVVTAGPIDDEQTWQQVKQNSPWSDTQWLFMKRHIWTMAVATALFLLSVLVWLGASDDGRRKLRVPVLIVLLVGLGLMSAGAWHSGEAIYRYGTAIEKAPVEGGVSPGQPAAPGTAPAGMVQETATTPSEQTRHDEHEHHEHQAKAGERGITYYIPPLQLHVLLAGLTVAIAVGALGVSIRRWTHQLVLPAGAERVLERLPGATTPERAEAAGRPVVVGVPPPAPAGTPAAARVPVSVGVFPARFWLLAFLFALGTAAAGLWMTGDWLLKEGVREPIEHRTWMTRLFLHVVMGTSIVVFTLLLALISRVSRRGRGITVFFALLLLIAVAVQVWLGILLLFDSDNGSVMRFN